MCIKLFSIFLTAMLHHTKIHLGLKLIYRINRKLFNSHHMFPGITVIPISEWIAEYTDDTNTCICSKDKLQNITHSLNEANGRMGFTLNLPFDITNLIKIYDKTMGNMKQVSTPGELPLSRHRYWSSLSTLAHHDLTLGIQGKKVLKSRFQIQHSP